MVRGGLLQDPGLHQFVKIVVCSVFCLTVLSCGGHGMHLALVLSTCCDVVCLFSCGVALSGCTPGFSGHL